MSDPKDPPEAPNGAVEADPNAQPQEGQTVDLNLTADTDAIVAALRPHVEAAVAEAGEKLAADAQARIDEALKDHPTAEQLADDTMAAIAPKLEAFLKEELEKALASLPSLVQEAAGALHERVVALEGKIKHLV